MDSKLAGPSHPDSRSLTRTAVLPRNVRTTELAALLLWRLRAISILFFSASLFGTILGLVRPEMLLTHPAHFPITCVLNSLVIVWLFHRTEFSLRHLRHIEIVLFGAATAAMGLRTVDRLEAVLPKLVVFGPLSGHALNWALENCCLYWWFLIILYGTWIPNTGRRCAYIVGGLVTVALAVIVGLALSKPVLAGALTGGALLVPMFWISAAAAIAIFGSYRINLLAESLATARVLGPYRVLRKLGSGAMGDIYLAEHQLLERPCALKLIRPERAGDASMLQRFEREVRVMARLTHWNIVEIYDTGHGEDGTFFYAMEYLPGLTLQDLVDEHGALPAARVVHLLKQICAALADVHAAGLVHRDIKPANIVLCRRGCVCDVVKVLDFGIVQLDVNPGQADLTTEGKFLGTPLYVSPEQIRGKNSLDGRSDLYSLGAVAYFLLTGEPPFIRDTVPEVFTAHLREAAALPSELEPSVPSDLDAIVLRCLEKLPDQRYQDATAMHAALSRSGCAGHWTEAQAESWWRQHHPEVFQRDHARDSLANVTAP